MISMPENNDSPPSFDQILFPVFHQGVPPVSVCFFSRYGCICNSSSVAFSSLSLSLSPSPSLSLSLCVCVCVCAQSEAESAHVNVNHVTFTTNTEQMTVAQNATPLSLHLHLHPHPTTRHALFTAEERKAPRSNTLEAHAHLIHSLDTVEEKRRSALFGRWD